MGRKLKFDYRKDRKKFKTHTGNDSLPSTLDVSATHSGDLICNGMYNFVFIKLIMQWISSFIHVRIYNSNTQACTSPSFLLLTDESMLCQTNTQGMLAHEESTVCLPTDFNTSSEPHTITELQLTDESMFCPTNTQGMPAHEECTVCLPTDLNTSSEPCTITELHAKLLQSTALPEEWVCSLVSSKIVLFKLALSPFLMTADFTFKLTISSDNTWILSTGRMQVNVSQCPLLDCVPTLLVNVEGVVGVLSAINKLKLCGKSWSKVPRTGNKTWWEI